MAIAVVWLKRDLRLSDHQPLADAVASGLPVLLLYCFEPMLLADPHYSARHWRLCVSHCRIYSSVYLWVASM